MLGLLEDIAKYNPVTAPAYWMGKGAYEGVNAIGGAVGDNAGATAPQALPPIDEGRFRYQNNTPEQLYMAQQAQAMAGRQAPHLAQRSVDMTQADANYDASLQARQHQLANVQALEQAAAGRGPSAAQAQLAMGRDDAIRMAQAMAASSRGGPGAMALAQRTAQMQGAQTAGQAAQQAAALRAQEMQAAQSALQGATSGLRGQDLTTRGQSFDQSMGRSQFAANQDLARANLAMNQQGMNDAMSRFYETGKMDIGRMNMNAGMGLEGMKSDRALAMEQARMRGVETSKDRAKGWFDTFANTAGQGAGMATMLASDRTRKRHINDVSDEELAAMLDALHGYSYQYKPGAGEPGRHVGVMAQDLERSRVGAHLVDQTPHGKVIDTTEGFGAALAALAALHRRVEALEGKRR